MFEIDDFVAECQEAVAETEPRLAIKEVLQRALSHPERVLDALPPSRAEVVPLYAAEDLTVLKVIWAPGMSIRPHNHLMWAAIGLYTGQEDNTFYRRPGSGPGARSKPAPAAGTVTGVVVSGGRELRTGDVAVLGDHTIHSVVNPRQTFTGAIHIYGGNLTTCPGRSEWDEATLEERPYDFERVKRYFEEANAAVSKA